MLWSLEDFGGIEELDDAFYEYHEERGYVKVPVDLPNCRDTLQQRFEDSETGVVKREWQVAAPPRSEFLNHTYQELEFVGLFESKEEAEKFRTETLAQLQRELGDAKPGSAKWWQLKGKISSFSKPLRPALMLPRRDNEKSDPPHVDKRKARGVLQDIRVGLGVNPNIETEDRFAEAIRVMQGTGALPGKNGGWKAGTTWGPKPVSTNWADEEEDEGVSWGVDDWGKTETAATDPSSDRKVVDTHHAFLPRHSRPRRIGLGYHGYDEVFRHQRDAVPFTSKDLTKTAWRTERDTTFIHVPEDETKVYVVDERLDGDNPAFNKRSAALKDDLKTILENHEKVKEQKKPNLAMRGARKPASAPAPAPAPAKQPQLHDPHWF